MSSRRRSQLAAVTIGRTAKKMDEIQLSVSDTFDFMNRPFKKNERKVQWELSPFWAPFTTFSHCYVNCGENESRRISGEEDKYAGNSSGRTSASVKFLWRLPHWGMGLRELRLARSLSNSEVPQINHLPPSRLLNSKFMNAHLHFQ